MWDAIGLAIAAFVGVLAVTIIVCAMLGIDKDLRR